MCYKSIVSLVKLLYILQILTFNTSAVFAMSIKVNDLIPREVLFGNPEKISPKVSHNGKYLSYLAPLNGVMNIYVAPIDDIKKAKPITKDTDRNIQSYYWTYDERIIYLQDEGGDENYHLYLVHADGDFKKDLTPFVGAKSHIVNMSPDEPNKV